MKSKQIFENMVQVAEVNDLTVEQVQYAFEQALIAACKRQLGVQSCRVEFKPEKYELLTYGQYMVLPKEIVSFNVDKAYTLIKYEEAIEINPKVKEGELLEVLVEPDDFSLNASRDFKNRFNEVLKEILKEKNYQEIKDLEHEMINVRVLEVQDDFYRIEVNKDVITLLPKRETLPVDNFHQGDRIKVYVTSVEKHKKGLRVLVSRTNIGLVKRLLEAEVPEIKDGTIEVLGISRDPGDRSKVGLRSHNENVDVIGATVGENGARIKESTKALSGEKIDLFRWSDNEKELIANSLQPSPVTAVVNVDPKEKKANAIVPDDQLSLAIGKLGQNVKLAVQASGWNIDIISESEAQKEGIIY